MSFNKLFLPEVEDLKLQLLSLGNEEFAKHWVDRLKGHEMVSGSAESTQFIAQFIYQEYESMDPSVA
jgi:hypothetical protein